VVAAPTGIAAINAGGVTLHSLLQLPFGAFIPENVPLPEGTTRLNTPQTVGREQRISARKRNMLREMELLIVDEVSMLRADLLDCMDMVLRSVRRRREPFGGVQLLFIGDLMQLPPVVRREEWAYLQPYYPSSYFFDARALRESPLLTIELQKIYRQSDQDFIDLLNRLRHNQQTEADLAYLNEHHYEPGISNQAGYIHLTTHNRKADLINRERLDALDRPLFHYKATVKEKFPESMYPNPEQLSLKEGAQVMFIKNDATGAGRFFNGKLATVIRLEKEEIWVEFEDEDDPDLLVPLHTWENKRYALNEAINELEEVIQGTFEQYPLKLAWAVTVHKSQGLTFEKAILDVSDTFAPGQLYVALSRLTSLAGLRLSSPLPQNPPDIDRTLQEFVARFQDQDLDTLQAHLEADCRGFIVKFAQQAFDFKPLVSALKEHQRSFDKAENRSAKQQYVEWTAQLVAETEPLTPIGHKFIKQVAYLIHQEVSLAQLADRTAKAKGYFEPLLLALLDRVRKHYKQLQGQAGLKTYREELQALESAYLQQARQIMKLNLLVRERAQGKLPTKDQLRQWEEQKGGAKSSAVSPQKGKAPRPPKKDKTPSSEISFRLFQAGKSPEAIAKERSLALGTVHGHLTHFVAKGKLPVDKLLSPEKLQLIMGAMTEADMSARELKEILGEEIGYGEIKLAQAHVEWQMEEASAKS
jgi:hypothetical protein